MKNNTLYITTLAFILMIATANAQNINWSSLKEENRHILNLNAGMEYSTTYGIGYGYHTKIKWFPVVAGIEYSVPAGNQLSDDFKTKIGGQIRWVEYNNWQFTTKIQGVFRKYDNDLVRILNFGSYFSGIAGYYKPKWFAAAEAGFDKAIVSHYRHSGNYKDIFPEVADGWYEPSMGGNFYYGIQTGISINCHDISLKAGKMVTQDFKTKPLLPFYAQIGYNIRF